MSDVARCVATHVRRKRGAVALAAVTAVLAACAGSPPAPPPPSGGSKPAPRQASPKPPATVPNAITGIVRQPDGKPAAGVTVRAWFDVAPGKQPRAVSNVTGSNGNFVLVPPEGTVATIEATKEQAGGPLKALRLNVPKGTGAVELTLAPAGKIAGKVRAPEVANVTDFKGTQIAVPGTPYRAEVAADGSYTVTEVAPGTYGIGASRAGLGRANATGVAVAAGATAAAPELVLSADTPAITAVTPTAVAAGVTVVITGEAFGATGGKGLLLSLDGQPLAGAKRIDDGRIELEVPREAVTGDLVVTVGGNPSNPAPLVVAAALQIDPPAIELANGASGAVVALATDAKGQQVPEPGITWRVLGGAVAVEPNGLLTTRGAGEATIVATFGKLEARVTARVTGGAPAPDPTPEPSSSPTPATAGDKTPAPNPTPTPTPDPPGVRTLAGSGPIGEANGDVKDGSAGVARFDVPTDLAIGPDGTIYVTDQWSHRVRTIAADGTVGTLAGSGAIGPDQGGHADGPAAAARFNLPVALAFDKAGDLFVADQRNHVIRKIAMAQPGRPVTTIAGKAGATGAADGPPGDARFASPSGLAFDKDGDLLVADLENDRIRRVRTRDGSNTVSTMAGKGSATAPDMSWPSGLAVDAAGNLFVAEWRGHRVRKISTAGFATTIAGSGSAGFADAQGTAAQFDTPGFVAVDGGGNVYVSDFGNHRVRRITSGGLVSTLAGKGAAGFLDGTLLDAAFDGPAGLRFVPGSSPARLLVVDRNNHRIRTVTF